MIDANSPWVILIGFLAGVVGIALAFKRPARWLFRRNIAQPASAWFRNIVREESTAVVKVELKQRNGGASLVDLGDQARANHLAIVSLETTLHGWQARLQEIGRVGRDTSDALHHHIANTAEFIAEQSALNAVGGRDAIEGRRERP